MRIKQVNNELEDDDMGTEHTPQLSISGVRTRLDGMPVLQIVEDDGECNIFVLYGDGSNEQHNAAYGQANRIVRACNSHDEMLEALEAAFELTGELVLDEIWEDQPDKYASLASYQNQFQAAIAKAKGES